MESITEGIFVINNDGVLMRLNEAGAEMLELKKDEIIGKSIFQFFNLIQPEERFKEERVQEYQLETHNENKVPVLFSESDLYEDGVKNGSVMVVRDISELKEAENEIKKSLEEKNVMLAEIHHRVKNNLAVISGLLQLQVMQTDSEEINKALTDSQLRVQSIALIHEKLYGSDSLAYIKYDKYIEDLFDTINRTYATNNKNITIKTDIEGISLNINQAIPCSLLVNEVLVNTFKHAFTETDEGEISISISELNRNITLIIHDNGKGLDEETINATSVKSLGLTLIKTLTSQLKGNYTFNNKENGSGTIFTLNFTREK